MESKQFNFDLILEMLEEANKGIKEYNDVPGEPIWTVLQ